MLKQEKGFVEIILIGVVVVAAIVAAFYWGKSTQIPPTQTVAPQPTKPSPPIDETANWKTYTNSTHVFSFRYPSNYLLNESTQFTSNPGSLKLLSVKMVNPNPKPGGGYPQPNVEAIVYKNDAANLNAWMEKHTSELSFDDPSISKPDSIVFFRGIKNKEETKLGERDAITFQSRLFESSPNSTLTISGNYIIGLVFDNENEGKDPGLKDLYPQILSTFKFLK